MSGRLELSTAVIAKGALCVRGYTSTVEAGDLGIVLEEKQMMCGGETTYTYSILFANRGVADAVEARWVEVDRDISPEKYEEVEASSVKVGDVLVGDKSGAKFVVDCVWVTGMSRNRGAELRSWSDVRFVGWVKDVPVPERDLLETTMSATVRVYR